MLSSKIAFFRPRPRALTYTAKNRIKNEPEV